MHSVDQCARLCDLLALQSLLDCLPCCLAERDLHREAWLGRLRGSIVCGVGIVCGIVGGGGGGGGVGEAYVCFIIADEKKRDFIEGLWANVYHFCWTLLCCSSPCRACL